MVRVLGIDPGLAATGFGVIERDGDRLRCVDFGAITTASDQSPGKRLREIYEAVCSIIERLHPESAGVESLYFTKNVSSAIPVAQARGVVLLALDQAGVAAREFTPQQIKQAVVGSGSAKKEQVSDLVRLILGMPNAPASNHASDALAAAIARAHWVEVGSV